MTSPARPLALKSATFADHEPVCTELSGQIPDVAGPTFGRIDMWPGDNVRRPANVVRAEWRCSFPEDPIWNLLVREVAFCMLHPTHSALQKAGIFLPPSKWGLRTTAQCCFDLVKLLSWFKNKACPKTSAVGSRRTGRRSSMPARGSPSHQQCARWSPRYDA